MSAAQATERRGLLSPRARLVAPARRGPGAALTLNQGSRSTLRNMRIGELAKGTGFAESQIRYWERRGLLPTPERGESGYRAYGKRDVERLGLLRQGKTLGLTLKEIRELLETAEMTELVMLKVPANVAREESGEAAGGCCEPECGPESCGPAASPAREEVRPEARRATEGGCCEPDCGPETCPC